MQNNKTIFYALIIIGIILGVIAMKSSYRTTNSSLSSISTSSTSTSVATNPKDPNTNVSVFENADISFSINYPQGFATTTDFKGFYHLPPVWRSGATSETSGTEALSIIVKRIENGDKNVFPRYFDSEVRIGYSKNATEIKNCYVDDQNSSGTIPATVMIGGMPFKKFIISNAAMQQYMKGSSYRIIHNNTCVAIEAFATGSNYSDPDTMQTLSQDELDNYLKQAEAIVGNFRFNN